jgi:hypothetical protein
MKNFGYQAEKFRSAVYALMLPLSNGEAEAIARACQHCSLAFQDLDRDDLDESASEWAQRIDEFMAMDNSGPDPHARWLVRAEQLSAEQKFELSMCIYELNAWFHQYFWSQRGEE